VFHRLCSISLGHAQSSRLGIFLSLLKPPIYWSYSLLNSRCPPTFNMSPPTPKHFSRRSGISTCRAENRSWIFNRPFDSRSLNPLSVPYDLEASLKRPPKTPSTASFFPFQCRLIATLRSQFHQRVHQSNNTQHKRCQNTPTYDE